MTAMKRLEEDIVRFLRGNYRFDEEAGMFYDVPCVRFRQGKRTFVSINLYADHYVFQVILGKAERERFERHRHEFPTELQALYDGTQVLHDGKWLFLRVDAPEGLEVIKRLLLIKKKPNRKPLPKENAVYGKCGHRCDLCVHYTEIADEFRASLIPHLNAVYGSDADWSMRCTGCDTAGCHCHAAGGKLCDPLQCLREKSMQQCSDCGSYPCAQSTVGYRQLEHRSMTAEDVTWAILPYVPHQYER